jgi:hypothetical protein
MKQFFETIKDSIWNPNFYAVMDSRTTRETLNYFLSLLFLTTFIAVAVISVFAVPAGLSFLNQSANFAATKYPANLKVILSNGTASTTPAGAHVLSLPPEFFSSEEKAQLAAQGVNNLLVINTQTGFENLKQFEDAKTLVLLTADSLVAEKDGGFEVRPIPRSLSLVVTKPFVEMWSAKILFIGKLILPFLIAFGFLVLYVMGAVTYFVCAAVAALILWAIAGLAKREGHYRQFLNTALYVITLPILLDLLLFVAGNPRGLSLPLIVVLVVVIWALNVKIWEKTNLPSTSVTEPPAKT